jgi:serine/threonine-protein kinase RsbW
MADGFAPLRLVARVSDLEVIRSFVSEKAALVGADPQEMYDILLAVTEAVTNILLHGYQNEPGWIEVQVVIEEGDFWVILRDKAAQFDPTLMPLPDLDVPLEERSLGGMGVYLIKEHMDRMIYRSNPQGGNELILVKEGVIRKGMKGIGYGN